MDIKRALLAYPGDETVQSDILSLYNKAYELNGDRAIPAAWVPLPAPGGPSRISCTGRRVIVRLALGRTYMQANPRARFDRLGRRYPGLFACA